MKTITITTYNRPDYTKKVLDALIQCDGVDEYEILIKAEPSGHNKVSEVIKLACEFQHRNTKTVINPRKLGCSGNIYDSFRYVFANTDSEYNIHLEDDIVPSKDCLRYFEWANSHFKNNNEVGVVSSYSKCSSLIKSSADHLSGLSKYVKKHVWFTPWGWATWRNRWDKLGPQLLNLISNPNIRYLSWDGHLQSILKKEKLYEVYPIVSRTQNIGALNGVHCPGEAFHREKQFTETFADYHNIQNQSWEEADSSITAFFRNEDTFERG